MTRKYLIFTLLLDITVVCTAFFITIPVRSVSNLYIFQKTLAYDLPVRDIYVLLVIAPVYILLSYLVGNYEDLLKINILREIGRYLAVNLILFGLILGILYIFELDAVPRSIIGTFIAFNFLLGIISNHIVHALRFFAAPKRVLVVCDKKTPPLVLDVLKGFSDFRIDLRGIVSCERKSGSIRGVRVLGSVTSLNKVLNKEKIDIMIIALTEVSGKSRIFKNIDLDIFQKVRIFITPSPYEIIISEPDYFRIRDIPLIRINKSIGTIYSLKRIFDLAGAVLLLLLLSPFMLLTWLAVRLSSPGPALYVQERVGRFGRPFSLYKFRTMYQEHGKKISKARAVDPRITPVGSILRRYRLDELPQLFNIIKGDMSFIGPRPLVPKEVNAFIRQLPEFMERFIALPGVTGLAQVQGDYYTDFRSKLNYDLWYIFNYSPLLDITIIIKTIQTVILRKGT